MRKLIIGSLILLGLLFSSYFIVKPSLCFGHSCYALCNDHSECKDKCFCYKKKGSYIGTCKFIGLNQ